MRFTDKVYKIVKKIPYGYVSSYAEIASALGNPKAYRAVGNALNKNPYWPKVCCHRIVCTSGKIGGFARGIKEKVRLLEKEGIQIKNGKVLDFEKVFYKLNRLRK